MTSLFKPKAALTPIPAQAQFATQIDENAGTRVEMVKQPDGSYAMVRSAGPVSAEDQLLQDTYKAIAQQSLDYMDALANNYDRSLIPDLDQYLKDYESNSLEVIEKAGLARTTGEEKALARFGQADSTAAVQARAQRGSDITDQRVQLGRELSSVEQGARENALARQGSLFSLATNGLNTQQTMQANSIANLVNSGLTQQNNQQSYNNTVAATQGANNQAKAASSQAGLSNLVNVGALVAAPFTGGASLALMGSAGGGGGQGAGGISSLLSNYMAKSGATGGWANYGNGNSVNWNTGRI